MWIKRSFAICLVVLFSHQTICHAKLHNNDWKSQARKASSFVWPIFFGGGTFFFTQEGIDQHYPGYALSGGLTVYANEKNVIDTINVFFFIDALYSYRAYEGFPEELHYRIEETSADIAAGIGFGNLYAGGYIQFPINTMVRVKEWTKEDFEGLSRSPSFSLMGGLRMTGKHLGVDLRVLLGQGPGQFLKRSFGEEHWLGQISLGFMGRI
ncbi:MAG: hypothetical protein FWF63_06140 [Fibromonadales bacterium]|nr:hypothetical protein [Fibromonadales bacterium]